jgi:thioredoxin-dependent peroxiredoxin
MRKVIWVIAIFMLFYALIVFEERWGILPVGSAAPDFTAKLSDGREVSLRDFRGKSSVVLYFYPRDFTSGCTAQACSMRDGYARLTARNVVLLGVSADNQASHDAFRSRYTLPFPLIADTSRTLMHLYGVERLGGLIPIPKRVTYLIDKSGVIRLAAHHEVAMDEHLADVLKTVREMDGERDYR